MNTGNYGTIANDVFSFLNSALDLEVDDYKSNFPPTNIYKKESGDMVFEFAVAGYDPKDILIKFAGDKLEVSSDSKDEDEDEKVEFFKRRIAKRDFQLKYSLLAGHFNTADAVASHKNGILKIEIPTSEYVKPRDVEIKIN